MDTLPPKRGVGVEGGRQSRATLDVLNGARLLC